MAKKRPKQSAAARIKEQGKSLVWVTLTPAEKQQIRTAAAYVGLPMSQFLTRQGLAAAEKIIKKIAS